MAFNGTYRKKETFKAMELTHDTKHHLVRLYEGMAFVFNGAGWNDFGTIIVIDETDHTTAYSKAEFNRTFYDFTHEHTLFINEN